MSDAENPDPDSRGGRDIRASIAETFGRCPDCGSFLNPRSRKHHCRERGEQTRLVPNSRREHRECRIDADPYPGGDPVLTLTLASGHRSAYHDPSSEGNPRCGRAGSRRGGTLVPMTRLEAQERGKYPCNYCYPRVAAAAIELYEERFGEKPGQ